MILLINFASDDVGVGSAITGFHISDGTLPAPGSLQLVVSASESILSLISGSAVPTSVFGQFPEVVSQILIFSCFSVIKILYLLYTGPSAILWNGFPE
ncbi:hypothetical protein AYI70_g8108 [Smittium culicis]|uniref:Uncharacterized protein n=1 Tax=Smittium culicis TaxID=133412 RepID=A0A1R1XHK7_9FUNG|nr:hypothetical protein AYI70_g8108 [Smittium culicis]